MGIATILGLSVVMAIKPSSWKEEEFQYRGMKGYVRFSERHPIENPLSSVIRFENGDYIYSGCITTDDGRKIRVYIPD